MKPPLRVLTGGRRARQAALRWWAACALAYAAGAITVAGYVAWGLTWLLSSIALWCGVVVLTWLVRRGE